MVHPLSSVARRYITLLLLQDTGHSPRDAPPSLLREMQPLPCCQINISDPPQSSLRQETEKRTKIMIHNKIAVQEICLMFNCWSYPTVKRNLQFLKDCHSNSSTLPTILLLDQEGGRVRGDRSDV